LGFICR